MTADEIIDVLGLRPHPEGGHYAETWRGPDADAGTPADDSRPAGTAIHFLLREGERSHWHRVDASEVWCFHAGAPLALEVADEHGTVTRHVLGVELLDGERPHHVVPAGAWQAAASLGAWSLVSCVVAPGFRFEGFELAPPGWTP